jgi:hypothetical protein
MTSIASSLPLEIDLGTGTIALRNLMRIERRSGERVLCSLLGHEPVVRATGRGLRSGLASVDRVRVGPAS